MNMWLGRQTRDEDWKLLVSRIAELRRIGASSVQFDGLVITFPVDDIKVQPVYSERDAKESRRLAREMEEAIHTSPTAAADMLRAQETNAR